MKRFIVAYAGAPQSEVRLDGLSEEEVALAFFKNNSHSNQIIVTWGLFGRNVGVFTAQQLRAIDPSIRVDLLEELPPPVLPDVKESWPLRLLGQVVRGLQHSAGRRLR